MKMCDKPPSVNQHTFQTMNYCFTPSHLMFLWTLTPQDWWCVINLRTEQQHTSNLIALSVTRYWFGSLPNRMMICVCLVWPADKGDFFSLLSCTFSLVPSVPDPSVISHPFQSVSSGVKGDPREWQRHLRHGMKIRVIVLNRQCLSPNPSARWPLSAREMANPPDLHVQNHMHEHILNKYAAIISFYCIKYVNQRKYAVIK